MNDELKTIEESFENIPEEVKAFIYGLDFVTQLKEFCKNIGFSEEQQKTFRISIYNYVAQLETEDELVSNINSISPSIEANQKIIDWVRENLVEKVLEISTNTFIEEESVPEDIGTEKVNPSEIIKNSLKSPSLLAPTKRDYSLEKDISNGPKNLIQDIKKPTIDPYREIAE